MYPVLIQCLVDVGIDTFNWFGVRTQDVLGVIKSVRLCPTEHRYVWHSILLYQFVVMKEHTPYAPARIAKPSYPVCTKFALQYIAPTLRLIAGTETVSKESYRFHIMIIIYIYYDVFAL
tara:strand:+ start:10 stop:366 length:357 start_codon:yes stop_codon:yes gene_type:complete